MGDGEGGVNVSQSKLLIIQNFYESQIFRKHSKFMNCKIQVIAN